MAEKPHILLVEDETSIADNIMIAFKQDGFDCHHVTLANEAINLLQSAELAESAKSKVKYDLVVLDVGLPDITGFEACKKIRVFSSVPIIFLTARDDEIDRVVGLEIGADDYMTKPFSVRELVARVRLRLKNRPEQPVTQSSKLDCGAFNHDAERKLMHFCDTPLTLTLFEYGMLCTLLEQPERVFSREQLMASVRDLPEVSLERSVDNHVKTLRAKLRAINPDLSPIKTHRGLGYSITP